MTHAKRFSLLAATFLLLVAPVAAQKPVKEYTIEQFMNTVRLGGSSFSADDKSVLFHSNKTGIFNVYSVPVTGGAATQLTNSTKESTYSVAYFPTDGRILYTYDRGGNENSHLYLRELDGSERDLTPGDWTLDTNVCNIQGVPPVFIFEIESGPPSWFVSIWKK